MILLESCNIHYTQVVPHYAKCQSRNAGHMDRGTRSANNNFEHLQHTLSFSLCHRSLSGINPTLPERLTGKQESKTEGMEGGRKKPRSRAYLSFTALQTLLTMSSRFSGVTVLVGVVTCFCSIFVEGLHDMTTTTAFMVGHDVQ